VRLSPLGFHRGESHLAEGECMRRSGKIDWGEFIIPGIVLAYIIYNIGLQLFRSYRFSTVAYSMLLAIPLVLCCFAVIVDVCRKGAEHDTSASVSPKRFRKPVLFLGLSVLLLLIMPVIGYLISFFLYISTLMLAFAVQGKIKIFAIAGVTTAIVYAIFDFWLKLSLPQPFWVS